MTEEQASERWCPMVRMTRYEPVLVKQADGSVIESQVALANVGGCNSGCNDARAPLGCRCIASQCAMWRWPANVLMCPDTGRLFMQVNGGQIQAKGYCGVAGKPEAA